tara:strand:+ start:390 stop:1115 length:726 start_codon:yes stop_codon:yes gene_type:complete
MATRYSPKIVKDNLILCLDAASSRSYSGSGSWKDLSNVNHGTINGATFVPHTTAAGAAHFDFDGSNDYVAVTYNATLDTPGGASFCFWFNDDTSGSSSQTLLSRGTSDSGANADNPRIELSGGTNNAIYFDWSENGADNFVKTVNNIFTKETWTHCVCTIVAGGRMEVYVDGNIASYQNRQNADTVEDPLVNTNQDIQIGGATWIPRYFNGKIACVQIYSTALSHANIKQNYEAQKGRFNK